MIIMATRKITGRGVIIITTMMKMTIEVGLNS